MFRSTTLPLNFFLNSHFLDLKIWVENIFPNFFQIFEFLIYTLTLDPPKPQNFLKIRSKKIHECSIMFTLSDKIDKLNLSQLMREIQTFQYLPHLRLSTDVSAMRRLIYTVDSGQWSRKVAKFIPPASTLNLHKFQKFM